jgi:hypothetical protein
MTARAIGTPFQCVTTTGRGWSGGLGAKSGSAKLPTVLVSTNSGVRPFEHSSTRKGRNAIRRR